MNHIIFEIQDDLAVITLNRPEVANGFHIPMCEEILEALELAEKDDSVSFILINAAGKVFSVGGDLVEMKRAVDEDDIDSLTRILNPFYSLKITAPCRAVPYAIRTAKL